MVVEVMILMVLFCVDSSRSDYWDVSQVCQTWMEVRWVVDMSLWGASRLYSWHKRCEAGQNVLTKKDHLAESL